VAIAANAAQCSFTRTTTPTAVIAAGTLAL
jgi:hypothetical protein